MSYNKSYNERYNKRYNRLALIFTWLIVFLYLIVDTVLTFVIVEYTPAYEFNPLVRNVININNGYALWIIIKTVASVSLLYIMHQKPMFKTCLTVLIILILVTLHNINIIIQFI